jgi:FAD/FMN-containing dehydrogenase
VFFNTNRINPAQKKQTVASEYLLEQYRPMTDQSIILQKITEIIGPTNIISKEADQEPYVTESRGIWRGQCDFVVKPGSTEDVSRIVKICSQYNVPIVPLGGNTGLVGGGIPDSGIVLSTERMNHILNVDPVNFTLACESGCILSDIHSVADEAQCLFPLSLAAEGSCRIGGNLSTNAGGVQVLRYGNARDLTLGLEVVLPNGDIWDGMRGLRKDNTGYDLKHLFIGAEGTLGIITGAVLKLYPRPRQKETALVAVKSCTDAISLFSKISENAGESLSTFEIMNTLGFDLSITHIPENRSPFSENAPWYVLLELSSVLDGDNLRSTLESTLEKCFEDGSVSDAVLAESSAQAGDFWRIRESIPEVQKHLGGSIKNDITVPISRMVEFLEHADKAVESIIPGVRPVTFGHIGDGNLHYNVSQPIIMDKQVYMDHWHNVTDALNDIVANMNGSFSAEHGIGVLKREELETYRSEVEVGLMKTLKQTLDPANIMNPGKLFL